MTRCSSSLAVAAPSDGHDEVQRRDHEMACTCFCEEDQRREKMESSRARRADPFVCDIRASLRRRLELSAICEFDKDDAQRGSWYEVRCAGAHLLPLVVARS